MARRRSNDGIGPFGCLLMIFLLPYAFIKGALAGTGYKRR